MKKIIAVLTTVTIAFTMGISVFADSTYWVENIVIPSFQGTEIFDINDNSYGGYLGMELNLNGDHEDSVYFYGVSGNSTSSRITTIDTATEGGQRVWVKYNDNKNSDGRHLYGVAVRSKNFNLGQYSIYGKVIY